MQDDRTINFNLPKPSTANILTEDVARLRSALDLIDSAIAARATITDINNQLATLVGSAPTTLDTLKELADAIGNNPNFATTIATQIASLQSALNSLAASGVSYNNAASGISATTVQGAIDYLKNISGGGSGGTQASYKRQKFTATAGQTTFTTTGYTVGYLEVYLNGVLLDVADYTASNGATVVLAAGAAVNDELVTISLDSFNIANLLRVLTASASAPSGAVAIDASGGVALSGTLKSGDALLGYSGSSVMFLRNLSGTNRIDSYNWPITAPYPLSILASTLSFATQDVERVKIDSSGRVTMPYQPLFSGYRNAGNVSAGNTVIHNTVVTNNGGNYNTSNGRFTCPVAGFYEVHVGGHAENTTPTSVGIRKNGTLVLNEYQGGAAYGATHATAIIQCAANDYIEHILQLGTCWGGDASGLKMSVKLVG